MQQRIWLQLVYLSGCLNTIFNLKRQGCVAVALTEKEGPISAIGKSCKPTTIFILKSCDLLLEIARNDKIEFLPSETHQK